MVLPTTLKRRHSLKGLALLPAIKKLKEGVTVKQLARMAAGKRTEDFTYQDVEKNIKDLTGESLEDLLPMATKGVGDLEAAQHLLHFCIVLANEKGQPKGQDLQSPSTDTQEPVDVHASSTSKRLPGEGGQDTCNQENPAKKKKVLLLDDVEKRISVLEKGIEDPVKPLKDKVRALCMQQEPSEPLILVTLDELGRLARKLDHAQAEMFEELYRQTSRLQGKLNLSNLCLTVLGGQGADMVTKAINKCMREGQSENKSKGESDCASKREGQHLVKYESPLNGLYSPPYPYGPAAYLHFRFLHIMGVIQVPRDFIALVGDMEDIINQLMGTLGLGDLGVLVIFVTRQITRSRIVNV